MPRQTAVALIVMTVIALIPTAFAWRAWYKTDRLTLVRWRIESPHMGLADSASPS
jgi:hypothetical protein